MLFTSVAGIGLATIGASVSPAASAASRRRFTIDLRCGSIGVNADQREAIRLAGRHGFESVTPDAGYLARLSASERDELLDEMRNAGLVWGAAGLPVDFRKDESTFQTGLAKLPELAKAMQDAGVTRVGTWIMPCHDELTYLANFRLHRDRLGRCAKILGDHGQRLGLEYVGPKTLWASKRHPFIHSMAETKELIAETGRENVGFVLDSWHWYTAHETIEELKSLTNDDVVACDLNDAPRGRAIDEQIDNQRELPAATGVIDLAAFLSALVEIAYDGPVRAEPFNQSLNRLDNEAATEKTAAAMRAAVALLES